MNRILDSNRAHLIALHYEWLRTGKNKPDLSRADLFLANLSRADLSRANLSGANLSDANLAEANLSKTKLNHSIVPEKGAFVAFKKLADGVIAEILIPAKAQRIGGLIGRKCRAEFVKVIKLSE